MQFFCNILNVFTDTNDQLNPSLLNSSIYFLFKKKLYYWHQTFER